MALVYLGLGSNIDAERHLTLGLQRLRAELTVLAESPWYASPALGFDGPDFINLVIAVQVECDVEALYLQLKGLETEFGRPAQAEKYSSRALDIDILLFDRCVGEWPGMVLPRPDIWQCAFVLKPLLDIAPDLICPLRGQPLIEDWPSVSLQPLTLCASVLTPAL